MILKKGDVVSIDNPGLSAAPLRGMAGVILERDETTYRIQLFFPKGFVWGGGNKYWFYRAELVKLM